MQAALIVGLASSKCLDEALRVFGKGNVSTHVIVGLGESEREAIEIIQRCVDLGILPALFAFTPVRGTEMEKTSPPSLESYRRVQLARFLIVKGWARTDMMLFDGEGRIAGFGLGKEDLEKALDSGEPFLTSGCSGCNRPFYNEKVSGPIYNYPRKPTVNELDSIKGQFKIFFYAAVWAKERCLRHQ